MNNTKYLVLIIFLTVISSCQVKKTDGGSQIISGHVPVGDSVTLDSLADINAGNTSSYVVSGSCTIDATAVDVTIGTLNFTTNCTSGAFSIGPVDVSSLVDSSSVTVQAQHSVASPASTTVRKDVVFPNLTADSITSGTYLVGNQIDISVTFDEAVTVSGVPEISLTFSAMSAGSLTANYLSGSGTSNLIFRYTVATGDEDANGIDIGSAITLNGGSITDLAGNVSPLTLPTTNFPAVLIAPSAPTLSITLPADNSFINIAADSASYPVSGSCDLSGATVVIKVDGVNATGSSGFVCDGVNFTGTIDSTGLAEGARSFTAELIGPGGTGVSAANSATKDTVAPTLTLNSPAAVNSTNFTNYSLSGNCSENGQSVTVTFGSLSNSASCSAGTWSVTNWDVSLEGDSVSVAITANLNDVAGNPATTQTANVVKDTSAPLVTITSPTNLSYINIGNNSPTFAVSGTCSESGVTVAINVNSLPATSPSGFVCDGVNFTGTIDTTPLSEAAHTLTAEITDAGSNTTTSSPISVTKDITAPTVTLNAQPNIAMANASTYPVSGTCSTDGTISVTVGSASNTGSCSAGSFSINVNTTAVPDGTGISVTADTNDLAGNSATQATTTVDKDGTAPVVTISFFPNITNANQNSYQISGSCSEEGVALTVEIGTLSFSPNCSSGSWVVGPTDVSALPDNPALALSASQTDTFGNTGSDSATVDKTTTAPIVTISSAPNITQANMTAYQVSGTCSENGTVVSLNVGGILRSPNCSSGVWISGFMDVTTLPDGPVNITADHATATQAQTTVNKDSTGPTVTISSAPSITSANQTSYMVSGTCSQNTLTVSVFIDSLNFTPTCNSGAWTTGAVDVSSIPDGSGIIVTADHSTATQASTTITKATSTPTVSSLSVPTTFITSADLSWTVNDPGGFTINDYVINFRVKGSPTWLLFSDGVSTLTSATVTGLSASTVYEFRVAVIYDTSNQSDWSNTAEGETKPNSPLFGPNVAMNVGGATDSTVVAYQDATNVTLNGSPLVTLNRGQTHRFVSAQFDAIDADKPIFTAGKKGSGTNAAENGNIVWQPTAWAGKTFSFNSDRETLQMVDVYAIESTTIEVRQGATLLSSATLSAGSTTTLTWTPLGSYQLQSTGSILAFHISGDGGLRIADPKPLLPNAFEIIGFPSNSMNLTTQADGTNYTAIHSNSTTATGTLSKAVDINILPQGTPTTLYQSESLLISADQKIFGASYADADGLCSAPFLPTNLMKRNYAIPVSGDYAAFASKTAGTIEVRNAANTLVTTLTLIRSGASPGAPYRARLVNPIAGYRFISTTPVAAWYQANSNTGGADQDETVMYGTD